MASYWHCPRCQCRRRAGQRRSGRSSRHGRSGGQPRADQVSCPRRNGVLPEPSRVSGQRRYRGHGRPSTGRRAPHRESRVRPGLWPLLGHRTGRRRWFQQGFLRWARRVSNLRPLACEARFGPRRRTARPGDIVLIAGLLCAGDRVSRPGAQRELRRLSAIQALVPKPRCRGEHDGAISKTACAASPYWKSHRLVAIAWRGTRPYAFERSAVLGTSGGGVPITIAISLRLVSSITRGSCR
jgi:hypothetical protein